MTIKSSGSSLSFSEIEAEFGSNGSRSLGSYRLSQSVGSLSNLPLDSGIPTSGQIKFSDFYGKQLNVVVDCHSGGEETRIIAKNSKWNNNNLTVIGGFRSKKEGGSKIIINVNKKICSNKDAVDRCALRTGSWDGTATVQIDVGSSGKILGSGGDGGSGAQGINNSGSPGSSGTSGLGIDTNNVTVNIASGGIIRAGFGGGGGGGNNANQAYGASGGSGANLGGNAGGGGNSQTGGGGAGGNGAAIRRVSGFTVNINNNGSITGSTSATGVG